MPIVLRRLLLNDLHHMCLYFEEQGISAEPEAFKTVIPDPLSADDWFRFHHRYANGEPIIPPGLPIQFIVANLPIDLTTKVPCMSSDSISSMP